MSVKGFFKKIAGVFTGVTGLGSILAGLATIAAGVFLLTNPLGWATMTAIGVGAGVCAIGALSLGVGAGFINLTGKLFKNSDTLKSKEENSQNKGPGILTKAAGLGVGALGLGLAGAAAYGTAVVGAAVFTAVIASNPIGWAIAATAGVALVGAAVAGIGIRVMKKAFSLFKGNPDKNPSPQQSQQRSEETPSDQQPKADRDHEHSNRERPIRERAREHNPPPEDYNTKWRNGGTNQADIHHAAAKGSSNAEPKPTPDTRNDALLPRKTK